MPIRTFILILTIKTITACNPSQDKLTLETGEHATTIFSGEQPLLTYVHSETPAPDGQNPLYKRSAYIHPLHSPGGEVLTRIQPPDHYHHYGIWNPWTHTLIDGRRVDFWNLAEGQGTVRFAEYLDRWEHKNEAGFTVRHDHLYFQEDGSEEVGINETWDVNTGGISDNRYTVDLVVTLNCPLEGGIILEAYRYGGGLGFRATEKWNTDNSTVLTSGGKTRADADGTEARWVIVEGESQLPEGRSGILFMSHPDNQAHPEPMRMWPPDQNEGKANVFFEFCPIRHQEWVLEQGKDYTLKYRMVVFDGKIAPEEAEEYWQSFSRE